MKAGVDIRSFISIKRVIDEAITDLRENPVNEYARCKKWAIRGLQKLITESLKSNVRYALLTVNKNNNIAVLPEDFKEEKFVGYIDNCGNKIPFTRRLGMVNVDYLPEMPCEEVCNKCTGCYSKQLCNDLEKTQEIIKVKILADTYDKTITKTLMPNGEYFVETITPVLNLGTNDIDYITSKEFITAFDVAECGCIKKTTENEEKLKYNCNDQWCCHCTPCKEYDGDPGGYSIFPENNIIKFDNSFDFDKVYIEYRGNLPKSGGEFLVPEVALETLVYFVKHKYYENKKGETAYDKKEAFDAYVRERNNMMKVISRTSLHRIMQLAMTVPKFEYNGLSDCWHPSGKSSSYMNSGNSIINGSQSSKEHAEDLWEQWID